MKKIFLLTCAAVALGPVLLAQPANPGLRVASSSPAGPSLYAQELIDLWPGFEATSGGFEAAIHLPEATAGRWSHPLRWTPYARNATRPGNPDPTITGMVGIHTHVLPNGNVLTWEGHNKDTFGQNTRDCTSHAYIWHSNPAAQRGGDR
jgi:hypothetical protein